MTLIIVGTIPGTASAEDRKNKRNNTNVVKVKQTDSTLADSPLHTLKKVSDNPEVELAEHETDILQTDSHILALKNTTEDMDISFKSSDPSILSVKKKTDSSCIYTGEAYGTAEIIVTVRTDTFLFFFSNETTYRTKISVTPHATSIKSVKQKISLQEGKKATFELTVRPSISEETPVFLSKDPKVATVSAKGKITAKAAGSTFVTATIENGKTTQCLVTVKKK
jgi:uncharacterized protein YjdB